MDLRRTASAVLVLLALASAGLGIAGCGPVVPDLQGKTVAQASALLAKAGLKLGKVSYDGKTDGSVEGVLWQDPEAGAAAAAGTRVDVAVAGLRPVRVPGVVNLTREAAQTALEAAGLKVGSVSQSFSAIPVGMVAAQSPRANIDVPRGTSIDLFISSGPAPVAVPKVDKKTIARAEAEIKAAGFLVVRVDVDDTHDAGTVVQQDPEGGAHAIPGTTVTVWVSTGRAPTTAAQVTVPYVKGLSAAAAKNKVEAMGLKANIVYGPGDGLTAVGFVYKQSPSSGTHLAGGSSVSLYVWRGASPAPQSSTTPQATVPYAKGKTADAAKAIVESVGLRANIVNGSGDGLTAAGLVYKQTPSSGAHLDKGATVTLYVWAGP